MNSASSFIDRFASLSESERTALLSDIWREFKKLEAWHALRWLLDDFHKPALSNLLSPDLSDPRRHFYAGVVYVTQAILGTLDALTAPPIPGIPGEAELPSFAQENLIHNEEPPY